MGITTKSRSAVIAAQSLGAIPVPFYEDAPSQEMVYVFQNADIGFAVVEDQEQADKLFEIMPQCPTLKHIWYDDPRGLKHYTQPELASYEGLTAAGQEWARANPGLLESEIAKSHGGDTAIMLLWRNGQLLETRRVEVGAPDSGGAGYRMLRVEN